MAVCHSYEINHRPSEIARRKESTSSCIQTHSMHCETCSDTSLLFSRQVEEIPRSRQTVFLATNVLSPTGFYYLRFREIRDMLQLFYTCPCPSAHLFEI